MENDDLESGFGSFVAEMRRRHVVRFVLGYAAAAFVVLQLAEIVMPAFGFGEGALRVLVIVVALGFLPATVLAWIYDVTAHGIRRTEGGFDGVGPRVAFLGATVAIVGGLGVWLASISGADVGVAGTGPEIRNLGPIQLVAYDPDAPIRSIAVLPLQDYAPDDSQDYFAAGLHEELISKLSMLGDVRVASRRSVARYADTNESIAQIGQDLGVDVVVEGSINHPMDRVRITLRVIHAASEHPIQTLQFEREIDDALSVQAEVADALAHEFQLDHDEAIFVQAASADVTREGQDAYLRGKAEAERGTVDGYRMALNYFEDAVAADPDFAPALSGLAGTRFLIGLENPEDSMGDMTQARVEAARAVEIDSASIVAREILRTIERHLPDFSAQVVDAPGAPRPPTTATSDVAEPFVMLDLSAVDSAIVTATTALGRRIAENARRSSFQSRNEVMRAAFDARELMASGDFGDAAEVLTLVVQQSPDSPPLWEMLARSYSSMDDGPAAAKVMMDWEASGKRGAPTDIEITALASAMTADPEKGYAKWAWERLKTSDTGGPPRPPSEMASAAADAGDVEEALRYLAEAVDRRDPGLSLLRSDPAWDDLRSDDRFRTLARAARSALSEGAAAGSGRPPRGEGRPPGYPG